MKTALLMGGVSEEREVSLMSGRQVLESLKRLGRRSAGGRSALGQGMDDDPRFGVGAARL